MTTFALLLGVLSCSSSSLGPAEIEIAEIELAPEALTVRGGTLAHFSVTAYDPDSTVIPHAPITFETTDPGVAVVDGDGTVWAFSAGDVTVTAKPGRGANGKVPPGQAKKSASLSVPEVSEDRPGRVTDLKLNAVESGNVSLSFTEVDDGAGGPADYLVRFQIAPLAWGDAADVLFGSCAAPVRGNEVGAARECSVSGLKGGTRYEFQMVAFRGSLSSEIVYGDLSNVVSATTPGISTASQGPPWVELNFEKYASTEELRSAKPDFQNGAEDLGLDKIFLDSGVGFGSYSRSMRYDWVNQGTSSVSIGRGVLLPEPVDELWAEVAIRWSKNFTSCHPEDPPCDHKTLFLQVTPDMNGRWEVHVGGGAGEVGPEAMITMGAARGRVEGRPDDSRWYTGDIPWPRPYVGANQFYDEQWHVVRLHAKNSTNVDTFDGRMRLWVDGNLVYDTRQLEAEYGSPRWSTNDGVKMRAILLGRNKDKGVDSGTESMWIGSVRAWREDPGW